MSTKPTALVIGAGVGGLAVANILAKSGYTVTVYEQNAQAGGRMGLLRKKGFTFDTGPSWYLMKDVFEHYFSLFGKKTTDYYQLARLDPAYKVFFENDEPIIIRGDYDSNLATFESREAGAARQLEAYLNRGHHNYVAALQYFLYNPFKKPHHLQTYRLWLRPHRLPGCLQAHCIIMWPNTLSARSCSKFWNIPASFWGPLRLIRQHYTSL